MTKPQEPIEVEVIFNFKVYDPDQLIDLAVKQYEKYWGPVEEWNPEDLSTLVSELLFGSSGGPLDGGQSAGLAGVIELEDRESYCHPCYPLTLDEIRAALLRTACS